MDVLIHLSSEQSSVMQMPAAAGGRRRENRLMSHGRIQEQRCSKEEAGLELFLSILLFK